MGDAKKSKPQFNELSNGTSELIDRDGLPICVGDEMCFGGWSESIGKVVGIGDNCFFALDDESLAEHEDNAEPTAYYCWKMTDNTYDCYCHYKVDKAVAQDIISVANNTLSLIDDNGGNEGEVIHVMQSLVDAINEQFGITAKSDEGTDWSSSLYVNY